MKAFQNHIFSDTGINQTAYINIPLREVINGSDTSFNIKQYSELGGTIDWGDQSGVYSFKDSISKTYSIEGLYTMKIGIRGGLRNVKDFNFINARFYKLNINDFLAQFPQIKNVNINTYRDNTSAELSHMQISGNLNIFPATLENLNIGLFSSVGRLVMDFSNFTALGLKKITKSGSSAAFDNGIGLTGDFARIPDSVEYINFTSGGKARNVTGAPLTYSAGKIWVGNIERISIDGSTPVLTTTMIDNILIDLNNSPITPIGVKIISFKGTRTSISNSAVIGLESKGFTVTLTP